MTQITRPESGPETIAVATSPAPAGAQSDLPARIRDILDEQQPRHLRRRPDRWWRRLGAGVSTRLGGGRGATFGTPGSDLAEAPPSARQDATLVLSGGGLVRRDGRVPAHRSSRSR